MFIIYYWMLGLWVTIFHPYQSLEDNPSRDYYRIWYKNSSIHEPRLQVPTIYKAYFSGLNFRGCPHKIWPKIWYNTVPTHLRILSHSHVSTTSSAEKCRSFFSHKKAVLFFWMSYPVVNGGNDLERWVSIFPMNGERFEARQSFRRPSNSYFHIIQWYLVNFHKKHSGTSFWKSPSPRYDVSVSRNVLPSPGAPGAPGRRRGVRVPPLHLSGGRLDPARPHLGAARHAATSRRSPTRRSRSRWNFRGKLGNSLEIGVSIGTSSRNRVFSSKPCLITGE